MVICLSVLTLTVHWDIILCGYSEAVVITVFEAPNDIKHGNWCAGILAGPIHSWFAGTVRFMLCKVTM